MSSIMDGINSVSSISSQIEKLKASSSSTSSSGSSGSTPDPKELEAIIEQNFNQMLTSLISSPEKDEEDKSSSNDFLASLIQNTNTSPNLLDSLNSSSASSSSSTKDSPTANVQSTIAALQNDPLALQAYLFNAQAGLSDL